MDEGVLRYTMQLWNLGKLLISRMSRITTCVLSQLMEDAPVFLALFWEINPRSHEVIVHFLHIRSTYVHCY